MLEISEFKGNESLEGEGVWVDYEDGKFKICSAQKPAYRAALRKIHKTHQRAIQQNDDAKLDPILTKEMAKHLLVDFKGLTLNGEPFDYSPENALRLMQIPIFKDFITTESQRIANFVEERAKADLKSVPALESEVGQA